MKNQLIIQHLRKSYSHMSYHNRMAPFPPYETEYVSEVKEVIENMEKSRIDYDELPVAACKYCKDLHIVTDELENDVCMRCGSINEIEVYNNIYEFNQSLKDAKEE